MGDEHAAQVKELEEARRAFLAEEATAGASLQAAVSQGEKVIRSLLDLLPDEASKQACEGFRAQLAAIAEHHRKSNDEEEQKKCVEEERQREAAAVAEERKRDHEAERADRAVKRHRFTKELLEEGTSQAKAEKLANDHFPTWEFQG